MLYNIFLTLSFWHGLRHQCNVGDYLVNVAITREYYFLLWNVWSKGRKGLPSPRPGPGPLPPLSPLAFASASTPNPQSSFQRSGFSTFFYYENTF